MPLANHKPANSSLFKTRCHVLQEGLELLILLPQTSEGWDYKSVPLHPVYAVLRIKLRALYLLGKHSAIEATFPCLFSGCSSLANTGAVRPDTLHKAWPMVGTHEAERKKSNNKQQQNQKPLEFIQCSGQLQKNPFLSPVPERPTVDKFYLAWIFPIQASPRQCSFSFLPTSLIVEPQFRTVTLLCTRIVRSRGGDRL